MEAILSSERQEIAVGIEIRSNSLESEDGILLILPYQLASNYNSARNSGLDIVKPG